MKPVQARAAKAPGTAFWRLLGDYEDLSGCETAALYGEDFATVAAIQALKAVIFAALDESCRKAGIDRREDSILRRVEKIADGERSNHAYISRLLAENAAERRAVNSARSRLRSLQHSYVSIEPRSGGTCIAVG